jgi:ATP-dependent Lon protease
MLEADCRSRRLTARNARAILRFGSWRPTPLILPSDLPVLALRQTVVFPLTLQPLAVNRPLSVDAVNRALSGDRLIFLALQVDDRTIRSRAICGRSAPSARSARWRRCPPAPSTSSSKGCSARRPTSSRSRTPRCAPRCGRCPKRRRAIEVDAHLRRLHELIDRTLSLSSGLSLQRPRGLVAGIDDPLRLAYLLASLLDLKAEEKQHILEDDNLTLKLEAVAAALSREIALLEMKNKIESTAQQEMTDAQKSTPAPAAQAIRTSSARAKTEIRVRKRIAEANLPEAVAKVVAREVDRLERMTPASPEYQMIRTYIDWVLDVPWSKTTEDRLDPVAAREVLDQDPTISTRSRNASSSISRCRN